MREFWVSVESESYSSLHGHIHGAYTSPVSRAIHVIEKSEGAIVLTKEEAERLVKMLTAFRGRWMTANMEEFVEILNAKMDRARTKKMETK